MSSAKREHPDDAPLPDQRGEITPVSLPSPGKKPRMENSEEEEEEEVNQEHHKVTPRMESEDEGAVDTEEPVRLSSSPKNLYTELVECHDKIYQGKSSSICKIDSDGKKIDKKEDEVNVNRKAILQKPNNVNFFNESPRQVHRPNTSVPLPFEMVSSIWKSVEALNVFKHIPQMPHFRKLASKCEEEREGRAIGMMVTYSNLADSIQRLQMCTKVTDFEAKIACLISLEENGFIVDPIRSHLQELLALRTNDVNSALKQTELEIALTNKELENMNSRVAVNGYEAELRDVRKKLEELRKSISEMEEKEKAILMGKARLLVTAFEGEHIVSRLREEITGIENEHAVNLEEFERIRSRPLTKYLL